MLNLDEDYIYIPNTKLMRDQLEGLNYLIQPVNTRRRIDLVNYKSICFSSWIHDFDYIKQTKDMLYCMNKPTLTEDQAIFLLDILHVCPDIDTFKEAMQKYIDDSENVS